MTNRSILKYIKKTIVFFIFICCFTTQEAFAKNSIPTAIIGGQGDAPYAAFIEHDASIVPINGLPPTGLTYRVGINRSGQGIIGGTNALDAYAALVAPNGLLTPLAGLIAPGEIYTVAINEAGSGIIGGGYLVGNLPYAAIVSPNGTATTISGLPAGGLIYSVAIDSSGQGIISGIGPLNSAYAALISPTGASTPLSGLPTTGGIFWAATNDSQTRFIGGNDGSNIFAAFVTPSGLLVPITGLPPGINYSVGINSSGAAIMGGTSLNLPYASLVSPTGTVTMLNGLPNTAGKIYTATLNDAGTGLIAGFSAIGPYGAFAAPDGTLTPLLGLPVAAGGFLDGAAIHSSGVGIVGGTAFGAPFLALAAPNGTLTYLDGLPSTGEINSIAIAVFDGLVPTSIGPFDSFANTQFVLSDALTQHCIMHPQKRFLDPCCECEIDDCGLTFWGTLFGNYVNEKKRHTIPSFSNAIAGALIGFDYKGMQDIVVGGGLAYAYNHVHYREGLGQATINQESAVLYATWNKPHFYMNVALWGGIFQTSHKRHSLGFITSKANPYGWNLSPHLELSAPFLMNECQRFAIDPFVMFDWANNWQYHFREHGPSGFNIALNNQYAAIFRSEIGIRLYETFQYGWGSLIIEEKGSYVNRTPTHKGARTASFIGAASSFDIETIGNSSKNLGIAQIHIECIPSCLRDIYASFDYQGEFGSSFQSHTVAFEIGKNF